MNEFCTIYLVRHGETDWNVEKIIQGHSNTPLNKNGINQAEQVAEKLKTVKFDAIFSSDLTRAFHTAEIIKLDRELEIQTSELLRERKWGRFQGRKSKEYQEEMKEKLEKFKELSDEEQWDFKASDDIESHREIVKRLLLKIKEISLAYPNKTVLIASHGGIIRNFLIHIGYKPRHEFGVGTFKNCGYVKLLSNGVDFIVDEIDN